MADLKTTRRPTGLDVIKMIEDMDQTRMADMMKKLEQARPIVSIRAPIGDTRVSVRPVGVKTDIPNEEHN